MRSILIAAALFVAPVARAQTLDDFDVWNGTDVGADAFGGSGFSPKNPTFDLNIAKVGSGPSLLSDTLVVNGVTLTPTAIYYGQDASASTLAGRVGPTMTCTACGVVGNPAPFTEAGARAFRVTATTTPYVAADTTTGNIAANESAAIEFVQCNSVGASAALIFGKGAGGALGWYVGSDSSGATNANVGDGTLSTTFATLGVGLNTCFHAMVFLDRGETASAANSGRIIVDGGAQKNPAGGTAFGNLAIVNPSQALTLGGLTGGFGQTTGNGVVFAKMWKCPATSCFAHGATNPTQWDAVAAKRFSDLVGTTATIAAGQAFPLSFTRATNAEVDIDRDGDGTRRLFIVGQGWPRVVARKDSGATLRSAFLSEGPSTNLALQSQTFDNASWTKTATDIIVADQIAAPDGTNTADVFEAATDVVGVEHGVSQVVTLTAASYTFSSWIRQNARTFAYLRDDTVANTASWINLATCAAGTKGSATSTLVAESWGASWCRIAITFTGTAAAHTLSIRAATADNTLTFTEGINNDPEFYLWGGQIEAQPAPTEYIATTTATATRNKDELLYSPTTNTLTSNGTIDVAFICPSTTIVSSGSLRPGGLSDGSTNSVLFSSSGTTDLSAQYSTGGVTQANIDNAAATTGNNAVHAARMTYQTNDVRFFYDGVVVGTDSSATMIANGTATRLSLLNNGAAATGGQIGCMATRLRVWPSIVVGGVQP